MANKNVIKIDLETPVVDWRRNNIFTIHRKDFDLLKSILPRNVKQVYVREDGNKVHIKVIMYG